MAIIEYDNKIKKDNSLASYCFYTEDNQGCQTVWFKSLKAAKKAVLSEDKIKCGRDLFDCTKCGCYYSSNEEGYKKYPLHACCEVKEAYAKSFE